MATGDTTDPRFGEPLWGGEGSEWPGVEGWTAILQSIYSKAAIGRHGHTSQLGSPSIPDQVYLDTDTGKFYASGDGTAWRQIGAVGPGSPPVGQPFTAAGSPGVEGTSSIAMRSDAKMPVPPWPVQSWDLQRSANTSSTGAFVGWTYTNGFTQLVSGTIAAAPAGMYRFDTFLNIACQSATGSSVAYQRLLVNGVNVTGAPAPVSVDVRCDITGAPLTHVMSAVRSVGPGDMTLSLLCNATQAPAQVYTAGSHILVTRLGPS